MFHTVWLFALENFLSKQKNRSRDARSNVSRALSPLPCAICVCAYLQNFKFIRAQYPITIPWKNELRMWMLFGRVRDNNKISTYRIVSRQHLRSLLQIASSSINHHIRYINCAMLVVEMDSIFILSSYYIYSVKHEKAPYFLWFSEQGRLHFRRLHFHPIESDTQLTSLDRAACVL